jgi:hypothetical protein
MADRRLFHRQLALALAYLAYVVLFCATVAGMASVFGVGSRLAVRLAITGAVLILTAVAIVAVANVARLMAGVRVSSTGQTAEIRRLTRDAP